MEKFWPILMAISTFFMSIMPVLAHPLPRVDDPLMAESLSQPIPIKTGPVIEVVVVGPGDQFYSLYGHLGILVWEDDRREPKLGKLFNFGMTNFSEDGYFGDFLGGRVKFWGDVRPYKKYLSMWTQQDRSITRYRLNLSADASRALYRQLKSSIDKKNRYFVYDTFRQNCATKVRDILDTFTSGALFHALRSQPATSSYRDEIRRGYSKQPVLLFLTEWFLGSSTDAPRTPWEMSFRPEYFGEQLTQIRLANGQPLVSGWIVDHQRIAPKTNDGFHHWLTIVLSVLGIIMGLMGFRMIRIKRRHLIRVTIGVGLVLIAMSFCLLCLQFWTSWPEAKNSWLLLSVCPIDALIIVAARRSHKHPMSEGLKMYSQARLMIAALMCLSSAVPITEGPVAPRVFILGWWCLVLGTFSFAPTTQNTQAESQVPRMQIPV